MSYLVLSAWTFSACAIEKDITSMYLGEWKNQISNQLMPKFFGNITRGSQIKEFTVDSTALLGLSELSFNRSWLAETIMLDQSSIGFIKSTSGLSFSFHSELIKANDISINHLQYSSGFKSSNQKYNSNELINQQLYAPGYTYSHGLGSLGVSAVFVQQNYIDNNFGYLRLESQNSTSIYSDKFLYETSRGLGYQLNFSQNFIFNSRVDFNYQSKIEMNESNYFSKGYSEAKDFDLPENFSVTMEIPLFKTQALQFKAKNINYSDINLSYHSGFPKRFVDLLNSPVRPTFNWDNLTVFSLLYNKSVSNNLAWNLEVLSRQQAPTTSEVLNEILESETASLSYKFNIQNIIGNSKIEFFASYADKPVLIGRTDFGRYLTNNLDKHIEAGLSWKREF